VTTHAVASDKPFSSSYRKFRWALTRQARPRGIVSFAAKAASCRPSVKRRSICASCRTGAYCALTLFVTAIATAADAGAAGGQPLPQFVDPLPLLDQTASGTVGIDTLVAGPGEIELHMREFKANVMPTGFVPANGLPYPGPRVFGYIIGPTAPVGVRAPTGPVIVWYAKRSDQIVCQ